MSYLCYFCLFVYSGVHHILRCVLFFLVLCLVYQILTVSGLSIFDYPFVIL
jgi:hypothetical protein